MVTAQIAPIAKDFNVEHTVIFFGASTLTAALIIDSRGQWRARPFFGWVSDQIGREYTMAIAFGWEPALTGCWGRSAPRRGLSCSSQR